MNAPTFRPFLDKKLEEINADEPSSALVCIDLLYRPINQLIGVVKSNEGVNKMSPFAQNSMLSQQQQQGQQSQTSEYKPKLVYATRQNHHEDPVELAFAVTDPATGSEKIITVNNIDSLTLFESTQEGQQWVQQVKQQSQRNIRRVA
jgi:hypothetical protein